MRTYSPYPLLIDVCVTNRCNLHCSYCSAEAGPFASKKRWNVYWKIRFYFSRTGFDGGSSVGVTGGEPFIRTDILDILKLLINIALQKF